MIRAPVPVIQDDDEEELMSKSDSLGNSRLKQHRSSNSLGQSDFDHGSEEPNDVNEDVFSIDADHADDEIDEPLDYEEQKRRRSFERRVHRQSQRRGSVEDYEQSDDVQFVQRIQSYNSLTGKEIARLQASSPVPAKPKRQVPVPVPGMEKSQQATKTPSNAAPGHQRKNTLDMWKEKAAEMKNTPAFPPHQTAISSFAQSQISKPKTAPKFQRLAEEPEDDTEDQPDKITYSDQRLPVSSGRHERNTTLQDWKSHADEAELKEPVASGSAANDFGTIEDQSWATNVKCGDTLKRFKQHQPRSITSSDFFAVPPSTVDVVDESITEEPENASTYTMDSQSDASSYQTSDDNNGKDPLMRELIRNCLRVIGSMSRSGLINQTQKLALKGLAFRKDKRIVDIAKRFHQSKNNAYTDDRELILNDMELAFSRLACNID